MNNSVIYLFWRLFHNIFRFLHHWYVGGFRVVAKQTINFLEKLDGSFALKVTVRNYFKPLYQDYTFIGYIFGFIFRSFRVVIAIIVYLFVVALALVIYVLWGLVPLYVILLGQG